MEHFDLIIAGGGPAGTAAAITAARAGARVLLLERGRFPRHKVCGEFVSPEGLSLLKELAKDSDFARPLLEEALCLRRARIFVDKTTLEAPVEPPAASITRFDLDEMLWRIAGTLGVDCRQQVTAQGIEGGDPRTVHTSAGNFSARAVINACGRWSILRHTAREKAAGQQTEKWLGIKAHFAEARPSPSVDLYFFAGGYCGVQPIGRDQVNACAMVRTDAATSLEQAFALHPVLWRRTRDWDAVSETVSTSPLVFSQPVAEENGALYAGDAAGFVDPFVGDGIAIALRSGTMAAEALSGLWAGRISLAEAVQQYRQQYEKKLLPVFRNASLLRGVLSLPGALRRPILAVLQASPVARYLMTKTRGGD